jgi:hypothetical protein
VHHGLLLHLHAELAVQYSSNLWPDQPVVLLLKVLMSDGPRREELLSTQVSETMPQKRFTFAAERLCSGSRASKCC